MPGNRTVEVITEVLYTRAEANGVIASLSRIFSPLFASHA
jgi:hypothetical protein